MYGYKKKKPTYQRARVNNFATSVTEGGQRQNSYKQNNYKQNSYRQSKIRIQDMLETRRQGSIRILREKIMVEEAKTPMSKSAFHVEYAKKPHMEI